MPTINQLVRRERKKVTVKSKSPALAECPHDYDIQTECNSMWITLIGGTGAQVCASVKLWILRNGFAEKGEKKISKASRRKERNLKKRRNNPGFQATMNHTPTSTKEKVCVFCGSREITRHHIIFQRFAPELRNDPNNIIPMCSNCQKVYHHYTDCLLSYLKVHGKIHHHEIREAIPLVLS